MSDWFETSDLNYASSLQPAWWISRNRRIQVRIMQHSTKRAPLTPKYSFQGILDNGATVWIDRQDILLQEEERLIGELARIMRSHQVTKQHQRYSSIMKHLLENGTPFAQRLQSLTKPTIQQQALPLFDDAG